LNGIPPVALPWASLLAFVRIKTNPRTFRLPASIAAAWRQVEDWLDCPRVWIPVPATNHRAVLGQLLRSGDAAANLVGDAHLAALAIEHGLTLCSADSDFARFPNLRWHNPLHGG
jgi:toxin-antitoxin system PIN domain toxin